MKRGTVSQEGRQRLRDAALRHQPWKHSTGPRTAVGKARVAANGKKRQVALLSVREVRAKLSDVGTLIVAMRSTRAGLAP